jgi:glycosyltransferase involved in cell wall biosynthesis
MIVNVFTHTTNPYDSYGVIACEVARHLSRRGFYVNVLHTSGPKVREIHDDELKRILSQPVVPVTGGIALAYPTSFGFYGPLLWEGPVVAITTFESDALPDGWVETLNRCDAVSTPSTWSADVFRNAGVTAPIAVNPEGISDAYQFKVRAASTPLMFLCFMDFVGFGRKGWDTAMAAFWYAFGQDMDYRLVIKARENHSAINGINHDTNPNIDLLKQDLTEAEMAQLYQTCDVLIGCARGEGFGRLPREFARTGGISLATNWSGHTDELAHWGTPINDYTLVPAWRNHERFNGVGRWADVDAEQLAAQLTAIAAMPIADRNARGLAASKFVEQTYTWDHYGDQLVDLWRLAAMKHTERVYA